jgi:hypothetical protein
VLSGPDDPTQLRQMILEVGLGRCDQGFVAEALMAPGSFAGLMLPHPIVAEVEAQKIQSWLIACQGVADPSLVYVERQSDSRQPGC